MYYTFDCEVCGIRHVATKVHYYKEDGRNFLRLSYIKCKFVVPL